MKKIYINGGKSLYGDVYISGMKNAALPIIYACILTNDVCRIENLPEVSDVALSLNIIEQMGGKVKHIDSNVVEIDTRGFECVEPPQELVKRMRCSVYLLGAELGRFGHARVGYPGGCDFGSRPIDLHFKGFGALGATDSRENGSIVLRSDNGLVGNSLYFDIASVGATINVMMAAVLADGITIIENAAREPHIVDLANFLNSCGAQINGAGTSVIKIKGVQSLHGTDYTIIPDMIEAGTYMVAAAAAGGRVNVCNVIPKHLESISAKLGEAGVEINEFDDYLTVISKGGGGHYSGITLKTLPYPGFPTDMHPQFSAFLATVGGVSKITEGIWENRFRYIDELRKMGADMMNDGKTAVIMGVKKLYGANVNAVDLRAGAAMIIAGLVAEGTTEISGVEYIDRGYTDIVGKLSAIGADIKCVGAVYPAY